MNITTLEGIPIYCLPDNAICMVGKKISDMEECPKQMYDFWGDTCIPEYCEFYKEE